MKLPGEADIKLLDEWCKFIQVEQYMSRVAPKKFVVGNSLNNELWEWLWFAKKESGEKCLRI